MENEFTYTVATDTGNNVEKHFPYNHAGMMAAYAMAIANNSEVWESIDGKPRYLLKYGADTNTKPH